MSNPHEKEMKKPTTAVYPTPVAMITCVDGSQRPNIITLAWVGVVCSDPPQIGIAVRPGRHSYPIIEKSGEFVAALPSEELLYATDLCGTISGRDFDKFEKAGLTPEPATKVSPPLIAECPVNMECKVRHKLALGVHDLFIGEVLAVHVAKSVLDEKGVIDFDKAKLISYNSGEYRRVGEFLERHGFSARKAG
jgi:flavin reductase (DIM6/NTAB) family NADH-FMN oxidoreductase RutF